MALREKGGAVLALGNGWFSLFDFKTLRFTHVVDPQTATLTA
jgi:hypothetical protein